MFVDDDKFYQELPYTLPEEQAKPPYVILGTGLQQCLLAAHLSKIQMKPGLILDIDKTYGGCLKTVTLKELHALATLQQQENLYKFFKLPQYTDTNLNFFSKCIENKAFRGYNIDLQPNFFFADSPTCELLRQAEMDKYMDFRLVSRMLFYDQKASGEKVSNVPLSKGKIFESKSLSLLEKKVLLSSFHSLAQIYHKFNEVKQDHNSTKEFDKGFGEVDEKLYKQFIERKDEIFLDFLSKKITKNNKKILEYMVYIICNYQYSYQRLHELPQFILSEYTLEKFILRFGKFLKSCGIYGQGPYLYVDNGIGDVPQSFSRIASIFGSTYILHPKISISKVEEDPQTKKIRIYTNLYPTGFIQTDELYYGPTFYQTYEKNVADAKIATHREQVLRVVILLQKTEQQEQIEYPAINYILEESGKILNPIYMFMFDESSHTCPKGYLLYQIETVLNPKEEEYSQEQIRVIVEEIIELNQKMDNNFKKNIQYASAYVRYKKFIDFTKKQGVNQVMLKDHTGIDLDSSFVNFKRTVGEKQSYFKKDEVKQGQGEEEQGADYQTIDLIERLGKIDLKQKKEEEKEATKQEQAPQNSNNQQIPIENKEEEQNNQKEPANEQ